MMLLAICIDIAVSSGADLVNAMNNAMAFLAQHCRRQNVKRDQKTGLFKLLNNTANQ